MNRIGNIVSDFAGLLRVCGPVVALRWLIALLPRISQVLKGRNLQPVDRSLGRGPFTVTLPTAVSPFLVMGEGVISGIREMYARDCYLRGGKLVIRDGDVVIDLGANIGNFTNLALSHGPSVRVIAVEPSRALNAAFEASVSQNKGFRDRVFLVRALLGQAGEKQKAIIISDDNYRGAPWISESDLIQQAGIDRIDLLKCDIEGGEFGLLSRNSRLLAMARNLAIEIHAFAGDVENFVETLVQAGFSIRFRQNAPDGSCVVLASRA